MKILEVDLQKTITFSVRCLQVSTFSTFRSSRLAGRGPGLTGVMLDVLQYVVFTGDEELLLSVLGAVLELHGVSCSLVCLKDICAVGSDKFQSQ